MRYEPVELSDSNLASLVYRYGRCVSSRIDPDRWFPVANDVVPAREEAADAKPSVSHARYALSACSIPCAMGPISASTECGAGWLKANAACCAAGGGAALVSRNSSKARH